MADKKKMTRARALKRLQYLATGPDELGDAESWHADADGVLLDLLNDPKITEAWNAVQKWYA